MAIEIASHKNFPCHPYALCPFAIRMDDLGKNALPIMDMAPQGGELKRRRQTEEVFRRTPAWRLRRWSRKKRPAAERKLGSEFVNLSEKRFEFEPLCIGPDHELLSAAIPAPAGMTAE